MKRNLYYSVALLLLILLVFSLPVHSQASDPANSTPLPLDSVLNTSTVTPTPTPTPTPIFSLVWEVQRRVFCVDDVPINVASYFIVGTSYGIKYPLIAMHVKQENSGTVINIPLTAPSNDPRYRLHFEERQDLFASSTVEKVEFWNNETNELLATFMGEDIKLVKRCHVYFAGIFYNPNVTE